MQMDVMVFMVTVPIPFIFGSIIVLNMFQNSVVAKLAQPAKGAVNALLVIVIGSGLAQLYRALAPKLTGALQSGTSSIRNGNLAGFGLAGRDLPFLIFFAEFFKFWPLSKSD